jgi:hypothetical protein
MRISGKAERVSSEFCAAKVEEGRKAVKAFLADFDQGKFGLLRHRRDENPPKSAQSASSALLFLSLWFSKADTKKAPFSSNRAPQCFVFIQVYFSGLK